MITKTEAEEIWDFMEEVTKKFSNAEDNFEDAEHRCILCGSSAADDHNSTCMMAQIRKLRFAVERTKETLEEKFPDL